MKIKQIITLIPIFLKFHINQFYFAIKRTIRYEIMTLMVSIKYVYFDVRLGFIKWFYNIEE